MTEAVLLDVDDELLHLRRGCQERLEHNEVAWPEVREFRCAVSFDISVELSRRAKPLRKEGSGGVVEVIGGVLVRGKWLVSGE